MYIFAWELPVQFEAANKLANGHVCIAVYASSAVRRASCRIRQSAAGRRKANRTGMHVSSPSPATKLEVSWPGSYMGMQTEPQDLLSITAASCVLYRCQQPELARL